MFSSAYKQPAPRSRLPTTPVKRVSRMQVLPWVLLLGLMSLKSVACAPKGKGLVRKTATEAEALAVADDVQSLSNLETPSGSRSRPRSGRARAGRLYGSPESPAAFGTPVPPAAPEPAVVTDAVAQGAANPAIEAGSVSDATLVPNSLPSLSGMTQSALHKELSEMGCPYGGNKHVLRGR